jgi:hypothetical protein
VVVYVISINFDWTTFIASASVVVMMVLFYYGSKVPIEIGTPVQYYLTIFTISLLLSIDSSQSDTNLIILVIAGVLMSMGSLYMNTKFFTVLSMWMNLYIVIRLLMLYIDKRHEVNSVQGSVVKKDSAQNID